MHMSIVREGRTDHDPASGGLATREADTAARVQFQEEGCDNCDPGMPINDDEVLHQCTHNFSGMIAVMNPEKSWCARWTRKSALRPPPCTPAHCDVLLHDVLLLEACCSPVPLGLQLREVRCAARNMEPSMLFTVRGLWRSACL